MIFLNHRPLKGEKLQLMGRVVSFSLCQAPTGIGNDSIGTIITSLIEYKPQPRPTSINMQFKRPRKIGIGKNRHHGAQVLQLIKCFLAPVIQSDCSLLPTCVCTRHQLIQGSGHLCKLRNEPMIISCKPKETMDFSNSDGSGPIFWASTFPSLVTIPWAEKMCPRYVICLQNSSHFEGLSFSPACSSFWKMSSSLTRWLIGSFKK